MKNIFLICPVRNADPAEARLQADYVSALEVDGSHVHWPPRDTDQRASGVEICRQNFLAMAASDEVHIFYSPLSQGVHFDMGMAFALGKRIVIARNETYGEGKSYPRMLDEWAKGLVQA